MISFLDENFSELNQLIETLDPSLLILLADENTSEHCLPTLLGNLSTGIPYEIVEMEPGEEMKNIETATLLWEVYSGFETDRKALAINVGGGVVTDMGGFVASTYKRGIRFINLPTTLLAMVDASIGGKTGIDHQYYKNIIGTFSLPEQIFAYPPFLRTLPYKELRSGFTEMLKHGLIASRTHWNHLKNLELNPENIEPFVLESMEIKQQVVEADFKEQNLRKTLNFGHTFGHAIESLYLESGHIIPHGEGVAAGMLLESHLSFQQGLITKEELDEICATITRIYPKLNIEKFSFEAIFNLMKNDKKNSAGIIKFSLIKGIGSCLYDCEATEEELKNTLAFYQTIYA